MQKLIFSQGVCHRMWTIFKRCEVFEPFKCRTQQGYRKLTTLVWLRNCRHYWERNINGPVNAVGPRGHPPRLCIAEWPATHYKRLLGSTSTFANHLLILYSLDSQWATQVTSNIHSFYIHCDTLYGTCLKPCGLREPLDPRPSSSSFSIASPEAE